MAICTHLDTIAVAKPEHVAELGRQVEAVVVGSAFVHLIERNAGNASLEVQLEAFARELKHGFDLKPKMNADGR